MTTETKTLNLFLLVDRTGSMQSHWIETINTVNAYVKSLQETGIKLNINLAFFDEPPALGWYSMNGIVDKPNRQVVQPRYIKAMTWHDISSLDQTIAPRGMTPLYDALCVYGEEVKKQGLKKKDLVQFIVMTDGGENCSRDFKNSDAKAMLGKFEKKGWSVLYLGANFESFAAGASVGAYTPTLAQYNPKNVQDTVFVMNASTMRYATSGDYATAELSADERSLLNK